MEKTLIGILLFCGSFQSNYASADQDLQTVIYGEDNRHELYQSKDERVNRLASSVVALFLAKNLYRWENGTYEIKGNPFGSYYQACDGERFTRQTSAAFCSGTLVGPDLVLTAGHCFANSEPESCRETFFLFDYANFAPIKPPKYFNQEQLYRCKRIIKRRNSWTHGDFALVQLDRPAEGRTPVPLRTNGDLPDEHELVLVGFPYGLPMKISDSAYIRNQSDMYYNANLDGAGGTSGAPLFSRDDMVLEGIHLGGEKDFVYDRSNSCYRTKECKDERCLGEDILKISFILPFLLEAESEL
jgi:V8-like Glu-specific endopeptidase